MESKSIIVLNIQFLADVEIIVESVIVLVDDTHASIGRRNLQDFEQMPFGTSMDVITE